MSLAMIPGLSSAVMASVLGGPPAAATPKKELPKAATDDIQRVIDLAKGDPAALRGIGTVFVQIADTPLQGFYGQTEDKCFRFLDDFLKKNYPTYDPNKDPKIVLQGGAVVLEPLYIPTKDPKGLVTSRNIFGGVTGRMTAHGVIRVTITPPNQPPSTFYFDLGSSTHLGNYGGADHIFFDNTPGFRLEMDLERAFPYDPKAK